MTTRRHPFSNGAQGADWLSRNCWRCAKSNRPTGGDASTATCEIERATDEEAMFHKGVSLEIAERMGLEAAGPLALTWDCPERETIK